MFALTLFKRTPGGFSDVDDFRPLWNDDVEMKDE
jgi:hypothetical protein